MKPKRLGACVVTCLVIVAIYEMLMLGKYESVLAYVKDWEQPQRNREILIAVRLTTGIGYTTFTSSVMKTYNQISEWDIHVFNDMPAIYGNKDIRNMYGYDVAITTLSTGSITLGDILNTFRTKNYKKLFLIDSEMIFAQSWRSFILTNGNWSFLSLYHSATMHSSEADCPNYVADFCEGNSTGTHGVVVSRELADNLLTSHVVWNKVDSWNRLLSAHNVSVVYPRKSLVMRIEQTNQSENFCGENEVPYGFPRCEFSQWIQEGIEFFFDRCTNPDEIYVPNVSKEMADKQNRAWARPVVVYSLYGEKSRYIKGALDNAKRVFRIYPGWKIWAYTDNSVPTKVMDQLCGDNVRFVDMTRTKIVNQMSWRFLVAAEPVPMFTILDVDYRMLARGKEATDDWINSGRKFHVMRDHPNHSKYPINGQMWGSYGNAIPNIRQLIDEYNGDNLYMTDINFLTSKVWPIVRQSVWAHDSYSIHKYGEDHPFPTKRKNEEFVGNADYS